MDADTKPDVVDMWNEPKATVITRRTSCVLSILAKTWAKCRNPYVVNTAFVWNWEHTWRNMLSACITFSAFELRVIHTQYVWRTCPVRPCVHYALPPRVFVLKIPVLLVLRAAHVISASSVRCPCLKTQRTWPQKHVRTKKDALRVVTEAKCILVDRICTDISRSRMYQRIFYVLFTPNVQAPTVS